MGVALFFHMALFFQVELPINRHWQRASGWLFLALVALPVLDAGWLGLPRRTPGAPGGHRDERVGEAKNAGPETTRAWSGPAQLLIGEQPR